MNRPLDGIIVLDMTRVLAGPYCTMVLSDLGARVIKVERPEIGDDSRHFGPFKNDESGYFLSINREKESITVDLKTEEGKEIIRRFVKKADVLVENFRPGTMEKLGLGYDILKNMNPALIYASSSGFGHSGPWSKRPAYDMIVQAMGGIMSITGWGDKPTRVGVSIGDITAGLFTAIGINAALYQRKTTGKGQKIDVAMLDSQLAILENAIVRYGLNGEIPSPLGTRHPTITPFQGFKTKDSWIIVAVGNDKLWKEFCTVLRLEDTLNDKRFTTNKDRCDIYNELMQILEPIFLDYTTKDIQNIFDEHNIPCTPINSIDSVMENPQLLSRNMVVESETPGLGKIKIAGNPIKMTSIPEKSKIGPSPELGEHNYSVLKDLIGYSEDEIKKLKENNII